MALAYTVLFLPLLPVSVITVIWGYGLCSLSPLLALPVTLLYAHRRHVPARQRAFMDWLAAILAPELAPSASSR